MATIIYDDNQKTFSVPRLRRHLAHKKITTTLAKTVFTPAELEAAFRACAVFLAGREKEALAGMAKNPRDHTNYFTQMVCEDAQDLIKGHLRDLVRSDPTQVPELALKQDMRGVYRYNARLVFEAYATAAQDIADGRDTLRNKTPIELNVLAFLPKARIAKMGLTAKIAAMRLQVDIPETR